MWSHLATFIVVAAPLVILVAILDHLFHFQWVDALLNWFDPPKPEDFDHSSYQADLDKYLKIKGWRR